MNLKSNNNTTEEGTQKNAPLFSYLIPSEGKERQQPQHTKKPSHKAKKARQRAGPGHDQHTTEKERNTGKPAHIVIIAANEKKV